MTVDDLNVWSGRASQVDFAELAVSGLASMYPAFDWSVVLLAIMDISARASSLAERPRAGHLGHQCSHAPGRPNLHLVLSSRRPRRVAYSHDAVLAAGGGGAATSTCEKIRVRTRRSRLREMRVADLRLQIQVAAGRILGALLALRRPRHVQETRYRHRIRAGAAQKTEGLAAVCRRARGIYTMT